MGQCLIVFSEHNYSSSFTLKAESYEKGFHTSLKTTYTSCCYNRNIKNYLKTSAELQYIVLN